MLANVSGSFPAIEKPNPVLVFFVTFSRVIKLPYKRNKIIVLLIAVAFLYPTVVAAANDNDGQAVPISGNGAAASSAKAEKANFAVADAYEVQPGDILFVSVWGEPDLQLDALVRPDGGFTIPLAGEIAAKNKSLSSIRLEVTKKLTKFVPDADVTVAVKQIQGNKVYVIGKVNRPGEFVINSNVDVLQALSMAGGTTQFADVGDIIVLRRKLSKQQEFFRFDYNEVKSGENLQQNIVLRSGDVVVVP
jgi:polysaccharide export outer membrane protein